MSNGPLKQDKKSKSNNDPTIRDKDQITKAFATAYAFEKGIHAVSDRELAHATRILNAFQKGAVSDKEIKQINKAREILSGKKRGGKIKKTYAHGGSVRKAKY